MMLLRAQATAAIGTRTLTVDLAVDAGEVVALVGPNGSGKSSTVDVLTGLRPTLTGEVRRATGIGLGWAPQSAGLLPRRRVRQQVEAFALPGVAPLLADGVDGLLALLRIDHLADRRPSGLSGGEAQRVAVARALAAGRPVVLDEPTSAQDPEGTAAVRAAITAHRAAGGGAIVVTHRLDDAWLTADRACMLHDLGVHRSGPPASFGATVLHGVVGPDHHLRGPQGEVVVPDATVAGPAIAIIHASAVTLHRTAPAGSSARNVVRAVVQRIVEQDGALLAHLDAQPALVAAVTEEAARELALAPGAQVWATCKASEVQVHPC